MRLICLGILCYLGILSTAMNKSTQYRLKRNSYEDMSCEDLKDAWSNTTYINVTPMKFNSSIEVTFLAADSSFHFLWYKVCLVKDPQLNCTITNVVSQKIIQSSEISPNATIRTNFNATRGNYCAYVKVKPSKPKYCTFDVKGHSVELTGNFSITTTKIGGKQSNLNIHGIIASIVLTLVVAGILIWYKRKRSRNSNRLIVPVEDLEMLEGNSVLNGAIDYETSPRVFLLHCFGDEKTDELVYSFEKVLEECFHCTVVHCKTTAGINGIITQTQGVWTLNNIRNSDKIIVVESNLACHLQETLINNKGMEIEDNDEQVFLCGLITVLNFKNMSTNYNMISVVRFHHLHPDKKLDGIVENSRFMLPESLPDLYCHLKEIPVSRSNSSMKLLEYWKKNSIAFNKFASICHL